MAMDIKAQISAIYEDPVSNTVVVHLNFKDTGGRVWEKTYKYNTTEPIKAVDFKKRVRDDLVNDLKPKTYVAELKNLIGKEFLVTI